MRDDSTEPSDREFLRRSFIDAWNEMVEEEDTDVSMLAAYMDGKLDDDERRYVEHAVLSTPRAIELFFSGASLTVPIVEASVEVETNDRPEPVTVSSSLWSATNFFPLRPFQLATAACVLLATGLSLYLWRSDPVSVVAGSGDDSAGNTSRADVPPNPEVIPAVRASADVATNSGPEERVTSDRVMGDIEGQVSDTRVREERFDGVARIMDTAVDRITFELLQSMEDRPTLVVWLFDQSGSSRRQREEIRERFDRIYEELGIAQDSGATAFRRNQNDIPLLTSVIGFGGNVTLFTEQPTDDLDEIKSIVDNIEVDSSGQEMVFTAVASAADQYKSLRRSRGSNGPQRNVLFVIVTDEKGDDSNLLEPAIASCRKWGIPVYVVGVPAPFGQKHTLVKYVDPDLEYDQSPQWAQVEQGPETFLPERVQVGFTGDFRQEPVIDSGFGPYALTRLCYETGGIYFTVHPNRNVSRQVNRNEIEAFAADMKRFFDPVAMARYRPDYLSPQDYVSMVKASSLRQALVTAAQMKPALGLARPQLRFVKRDDAQLVADLTRAQQDAAKLEPRLVRMAQTLEPGIAARESETSPRWKAGFDLAMGRVLAQKVRTETYNAMLAKAKRGMPFKDPKNNTWVLVPSDEVSVGSKWKNEADRATQLLNGVVDEHKGTPWALLASEELKAPIGWTWKEDFTDLTSFSNTDRPGPEDPGSGSEDPSDTTEESSGRRVPIL